MPCSRGSGCPLGVDAPAMADALRVGDRESAYAIARATNPFASSCGHGCHAPCESACRRRYFGAPVDIAGLEMFAAGFTPPAIPSYLQSGPCTSAHDVRSVAGLRGLDPRSAIAAPRSGKRVAVVGAGAAGLACAHDLILLGHDCVIFDTASEPGGVLTHGIPAFRFPVNGARAESAAILAAGAAFEGGRQIASSDDVRALLSDAFDAVFLGIGASAAREAAFVGQRAHPHVLDAMELLSGSGAPMGGTVVVGEGVLAVDAARTVVRRALRAGRPGLRVRLVLREDAASCTISPEMLAAAAEEGVLLDFGWEPSRYLEGATRQLLAVEVVRPRDRSAMVIPCEDIVVAGARSANVTAFWPEIASSADRLIAVDPETLQTSMFGVWAGGACAFGHRSIAHAAADGKRAAWQIHGALTQRSVTTALSSAWVELESWSAARAPLALATQRGAPPAGALPPADPFGAPLPPVDPFAGAASGAAEAARSEAARCFDCTVLPHVDDSCTSCGKCVKVCEPGALSLTAGPPPRLTLDQDVCTRCGECVHACPEGAIAMLRLVWEERLVAYPLVMRSRPGGETPPGRSEESTATADQGSA
ncbi:MAG TPA: FAD-dependent oxidoreductase [Gemmatimonadaceae bacterium]|nr:FAD-dependent oxidoreductase [Gemmatimonadaceae bacterium]